MDEDEKKAESEIGRERERKSPCRKRLIVMYRANERLLILFYASNQSLWFWIKRKSSRKSSGTCWFWSFFFPSAFLTCVRVFAWAPVPARMYLYYLWCFERFMEIPIFYWIFNIKFHSMSPMAAPYKHTLSMLSIHLILWICVDQIYWLCGCAYARLGNIFNIIQCDLLWSRYNVRSIE